MEKELKAAIKKIMKFDFYDEKEQPIIVTLKGKDEEGLKSAFLKAVLDIMYVKDDDDDFRVIGDEELQKLLGNDIVDLFQRASATPQEFTEEEVQELKEMAEEVILKEEEAEVEQKEIIEEKSKKRRGRYKKAVTEESVKEVIQVVEDMIEEEKIEQVEGQIETVETTEEKRRRIRRPSGEDPFINPSAVTKAVMTVCDSKKPDSISIDDLVNRLKQDGYTISKTTARIQRDIAIKTIKYLKQLGRLQ